MNKAIIERGLIYIRNGRKHVVVRRYRGKRGKKLDPWMRETETMITRIIKRPDVQVTASIHRDVLFEKSGNTPRTKRNGGI